MSKTIDEKIVQMKFDNSQFEQNVSKSLKTLDTLKFKLKTMDFSKSASDLESVGSAAKRIDLSGLSQGIETVHAKFSALQVMGITALANITNSAVNAGKRIVNALGDSLINGGRNRAQKIKDAKFQMEGLLGTEEYLKQWDRIDESINFAVRDTAYGYDSAARAASQFLASNVKIGNEMDKSLRAISGVSAMTNSTYDDISNIFTRVAGQGRVMAIDLNSLAARGMNAAAVLGKALNKTEAEIREMVSHGEISFQDFANAMDDAFGEHAKKGNETFQGALANMKAAMSRIGAKVWDPLLDNQRDVFNQARLLINDLNNNYLNGSINSINSKLTEVFQRIVKFFELGGVKNILLGIGNVLSYVNSLLKPISESFREIFPKKSVESLVEYTKKFKEFTSTFKLSEKTSNNLKNTFRGLFSILSTGLNLMTAIIKGIGKILSKLTGIPGGILGITGALGNWITKVTTAIKESNIFNNVIQGLLNIIENITKKFKEFTKNFDIFSGLVNGIKKIFILIGQVLKEFAKVLGEALRTGDIKAALDVFNTSVFSGILLNIKNITKSLQLFFGTVNKGSVTKNLSLIISNLKDSLYALQFDIKADALMRIAKAIAILAASLFVLSLIKPERLAAGLGGLAFGIIELMAALKYLDKFTEKSFKNLGKLAIVASVIKTLSTSLLILAVALKIMGTMDIKEMGIALLGMTAGLFELCKVAKYLNKYDKDITQSAKSIKKLATSLVILALALKIMGTMDIKEMGVALLGMTAGLIAMTVAINKLPVYKKEDGKIASMTKMAFSLILLGIALKILASIGWPNILTGLGAMGGALAILIGFVYLLPKDLKELNAKVNALNMMALGLGFLGFILKDLGKMKLDQVGTALAAMGGALLELLIFLRLIPKNVNAASFVGLAFSILLIATAMKILGSLEGTGLLISLGALAGAFIILGVAGLALKPLVPVLAALAAVMGLFGAGVYLMGVGVIKFAAGLAALAAALTAGVTTIVAGIQAIILGIAQLFPELIKIFGNCIKLICEVIIECAPMIANTVLTVILDILKSLADTTPLIVKELARLIIGILRSLADYLPDILVAAAQLLEAFFKGIIRALKELNPSDLLEGIAAIGMLTTIFMMLSTLTILFPAALLGVMAFGVLITELSAVIAAIGKLAKTPGLSDIIKDGGNFLQILGTAIGQFIGGILGGLALGITSVMPEIANNLSAFMNNLIPFIELVKTIDGSIISKIALLSGAILLLSGSNFISGLLGIETVSKLGVHLSDFMNNSKDFIEGVGHISPKIVDSVKSLASAILILTGANLLDSITSWVTGGSSLSDFGKEISGLGIYLKQFGDNLGTFNDQQVRTIECAGDAIKALATAAKDIPNEGGLWSKIAGENSISQFGEYLPGLGTHLKNFVINLGTFTDDQVRTVESAGNAIIALSEAAKNIPNEGGLWAAIAGDNSIGAFSDKLPGLASNLNEFVSNLDTFTDDQVKTVGCAGEAIKILSEAASQIPNSGGIGTLFTGDNDISKFGEKLPGVGLHIKQFVENLGTFTDEQVKIIGSAANALKTLSEAASQIPNSGGIGTLFTGDNDISKFGEKLPTVAIYLKQFVENLGTFTDEQVKTVGCAGNAIKTLSEAANDVPTRGLIDWFTGEHDISSFSGKLPGVATHLKQFVENLGTFTDEQCEYAFFASETIKILSEAANDVPTRGLIDWFTGEHDISSFSGKLPGVATHLKQFVENLGTFTDEQVTTVGCAGNAIKALATAANEVPTTNGGLKKLFEGDNDISSFVDKFPGLATNLKLFIENIGSFDDNYIESVNSAVSAIIAIASLGNIDIKTTGDNLNSFGDNMITFATDLHTYLDEMGGVNGEVLTSCINKTKELIEMANTLSSENVDSLNTFGSSLATIGQEGVKGFVEAFTNETTKNNVINGIRDIITEMLNEAENKRNDVVTKFESIAEEAVNALSSWTILANAEDAGKSFAQGFANGISNNKYLATDAASSLGDAAYEAARIAIDSHSPSKKAHKLGNFFGEGFVIGLKDYNSKVYDTSYNVGEKARTGLSNAISKISKIINSDMDVQPKIRPILDLSNIRSGVGTLNTMLNNPSLGVMTNLNAISTGMRSNRQNGGEEVVSAIDRLSKNLGNTSGDTYNINGITYDNGSEISDAVQTLIRAARIERRA